MTSSTLYHWCPRIQRSLSLYSAGIGPSGKRNLRIEGYLEDWITKREVLGGIRPHTAADYRDLTRLHITPALGHIPLHRVSAQMLETLYTDLIKKGLSAGTVRKVAAILRASLRAAVRTNLIMHSPTDHVMLPPASKRAATIWTPAQIHAYLADVRETGTPALYGLYSLLFGAGVRIEEATGASDDAFDGQRVCCGSSAP